MQMKVPKKRSTEEDSLHELGKRKRKDVESTNAVKAGKFTKQPKKKVGEDAAAAGAKKNKKMTVPDADDRPDSQARRQRAHRSSSSSSSSFQQLDLTPGRMRRWPPRLPSRGATTPQADLGFRRPRRTLCRVSNFNIPPGMRRLEIKGISTLYGIQAQTFQTVLDGKDLVGRARTGCGKTLAFVLPIIEAINKENRLSERSPDPRTLVAPPCPTRELGNRCMLTSSIGTAFKLNAICVYGGAPYGEQERALRSGCDIVVGTPDG